MPYDEPDETDPLERVGVQVPAGEDLHREVVTVFSDEFARQGYNDEQIMFLFQNPFYSGAHVAYRALGDAVVRQIVKETAGFWSHVQIRDREPDPLHLAGVGDAADTGLCTSCDLGRDDHDPGA